MLVESVLDDVGVSAGLEAFARREYLYVPGLSNRLGASVGRLLPRRLLDGWVAGTYRRALAATTRG